MKKDYTHFNLFEPKILPLHEVVENKNYQYPRFQRDFVWNTTKMKELVESIYHGIPINSIYLWKRVGVVLKDRSESDEQTLLVIDGQQRLTSLRAILLGHEYQKGNQTNRKIKIAFNPVIGTFHEVKGPFTPSERHIENIAQFYADPDAEREAFLERNQQNLTPEKRETAIANLARLENIKQYSFIVYNLSNEVDIEVAYTCFERTNQAGTKVSQGDLCMSWLETYQPLLAEGIVIFGKGIQGKAYEESRAFRRSTFADALEWLKVHEPVDEPFKPKIGHIVELLFHVTQGGGRFKLGDIAQQLLHDEEPAAIGNETAKTENGCQVERAFLSLVDKTNYTRFNRIIVPFSGMRETDKKYAYWLFLQRVAKGERTEKTTRLLQRWYFLQLMSHVRATGAVAFSRWIEDFKKGGGLEGYLKSIEDEIKPDLWNETLPVRLSDSLPKTARDKVLKAWTMVHVLSGDTALFDSSAFIANLKGDKSEHHIYPQKVLETQKVPKGKIDAIANMAITTAEINSAIGPKPLNLFMTIEKAEGRLRNAEQQLTAHCVPEGTGELEYEDFLSQRAKLMAKRFKDAYLALKA